MQTSDFTVTLITGGSRSGKSSHALELTGPFKRKVFIATAQAMDEEMRIRIANHQKERGDRYQTVEEPIKVAEAIKSIGSDTDVVILDCLTVWMGNLMFHLKNEEEREREIDHLLAVLEKPSCSVIVVTNEVGMGIVPENKLSRQFRDAAGYLNQQVAKRANRVVLMVSGIPVEIKG